MGALEAPGAQEQTGGILQPQGQVVRGLAGQAGQEVPEEEWIPLNKKPACVW